MITRLLCGEWAAVTTWSQTEGLLVRDSCNNKGRRSVGPCAKVDRVRGGRLGVMLTNLFILFKYLSFRFNKQYVDIFT